jgi:hypothetical protein
MPFDKLGVELTSAKPIYIGPELWGLFFIQLMVIGWLKAAKRSSEGRVGWLGLGAGASYGAGMMMRPEFSLFLPFFLIFAFYTFLSRLRFVGAFVLGVFIVAVPWIGRNYIVYQKPLLLTVVQTKYNYKKDFGELEKIGVTFEDARHDLGRMVLHAPFVLRYLAGKWWKNSRRFWSWRTFFKVPDFLFLAPFTAFAFTATLAVYGCLLIGLFQGWSVNPKSGVLYVLLGCFVFINSLPGPYYWHMYKVVPTLHIFEALGFLLLLSYIFQSSELFALSTAHKGGKAFPLERC